MQIIDRQKVSNEIQSLKEKHGKDRSALIPILQALQEIYGYLPYIVLQETAHSLGIHPSEVEGVASFYSFFRTKEKQGKYVIRLCQTISCNLAKKANVARQLENELGIKFGQTTHDGMFTLEYTNCLGMCDQGPAFLKSHAGKSICHYRRLPTQFSQIRIPKSRSVRCSKERSDFESWAQSRRIFENCFGNESLGDHFHHPRIESERSRRRRISDRH
ncbi:MAG: NAD(P)H-dependent oxidoreductase subunit E [Candidatus Marinimicrobia bacterium]|nr:NAD(P)H-dependent oxidoreductase subunit E [Candidatus Neomarinimicrobiota bacterium]